MNSQWQTFLSEQGAVFDDHQKIKTFGNPELERFLIKNGPVICNLSHQALLKVTGEEAFDFLQGQFSNDLKDVSDSQGQLTAYCDPKGNVLALINVFKQDNAIYLSFDGSLRETIFKRLTMFKMRAQVDLEDISDSIVHIGYAGDFADLDIQRLLSTKIKDMYEVSKLEDKDATEVIAIKLPGPYHRFSLFGDAEQMQFVWKELRNNSEPTNSYDWDLLNIVSGQPEIQTATSNQFIAQFLNLDKLNGINFKKGCFPGQEVIARMHYRGKVTKRMLRLHISEVIDIKPGDELKLSYQERSYTFNVILAAEDIYDGMAALAVTTVKPLEKVVGSLTTESGAEVMIEPMPYDLTEE